MATIPDSDWPEPRTLVRPDRANNLLAKVIDRISEPLDIHRIGREVLCCEPCILCKREYDQCDLTSWSSAVRSSY